MLATVCDEFTEVTESGQPIAPEAIAKGYGLQLGCIVRESMSINTKYIRHADHAALVDNLLKKLHKRYRFPEQFRNLERKNPVNKLALTKMSNTLSSWKTRVKNSIDKGESWEVISKKNPMLDEEEFRIFKADIATADAIKWTQWGRSMREQNIGNHHLGSGGYRGKQAIWDKEDAELERLGKDNPWLKITDLQLRQFVRARYYLDKETGEFITDDPEVKEFEKNLVRNLSPISSLLRSN